jgi:predicted Zn finger-like uncharacterized protein
MLTTCPECRTTFRVSESHLSARQGMVRCGHCRAVFNAYDTLLAEFETPPGEDHLDSDIVTDKPGWQAPEWPAASEGARDDAAFESALASAILPETSLQPDPPFDEVLEAFPADSLEPFPAETIAELAEVGEPAAVEESSQDILLSELPTRKHAQEGGFNWTRLGYALLSLFLALLFAGQLIYFLRGEIVSQHPDLRPILERTCAVFGCRIPLAQDLGLVRIESSSLETDPEQPAHARLRVSIVNRSNAEHAWPHLLLKLTDAKNAPLAQRAFAPADYLGAEVGASPGLTPMSEHEFSLDLDLAAIAASGFEVKLIYP